MRECGTSDNFDSGTQNTLFIFRMEIDEDNPLHSGIFAALSLSRSRAILATWRVEDKITPQSSGSFLASSLLEFERNGFSKIFWRFWSLNVIFETNSKHSFHINVFSQDKVEIWLNIIIFDSTISERFSHEFPTFFSCITKFSGDSKPIACL